MGHGKHADVEGWRDVLWNPEFSERLIGFQTEGAGMSCHRVETKGLVSRCPCLQAMRAWVKGPKAKVNMKKQCRHLTALVPCKPGPRCFDGDSWAIQKCLSFISFIRKLRFDFDLVWI